MKNQIDIVLGMESYPNTLVKLKNKINKNKDRNGVVLVGFNKNPFYPPHVLSHYNPLRQAL
jgi:hypothetical protein